MAKSVFQNTIEVDILIVEDSLTQTEQLKYLLEKNFYSVITAENGYDALTVLEKHNPAIIISDICMPEMDGYELCRRVKMQNREIEIPVILLTSLSNPEDVIKGLECGADNFITKPYAEDYLLSNVQQIIANRIFYQTERIHIGVEILFAGKRRFINANQQQILTLLISTFEAAVLKNKELLEIQEELQTINDTLEDLVEKRTKELKRNENKYQDLYDNAPTMFMSVEYLTGKVIECNETLLKKTGFNRSEVIGKLIFDRFHPDCQETVIRSFQLFNETGESINLESELITTSGSNVTVLVNSTAVRDDQGNILHSRTDLQDISELKQVQQRLVKATAKAIESDKLKSAFLANMSHEIRTPLNAIVGFSQLLKEKDLPIEEKETFIEAIDNSSTQLLHIITDIMDISKIEAGQEKTHPVAFNLNDILDEINCLFQPLANQRNLKLYIYKNFSSNHGNIISDPVKLRQILNNIIGNALKFTETGSIEVNVKDIDNQLVFSIKDTGIGIEPSLQEAIFDRFRQVELTQSRKYGGTGLGLSLAKSYIEMLGGTIRVDSVPGDGSTFIFYLPLVPVIIQKVEERVEKRFTSNADAWKGITLLIAEDEELNSFYIQSVLKLTGIKIVTAQNGLEAIDQCQKNQDISIVLMDIKMPEMDGIEATRIIKSFRKNMTIIATTAYTLSGDREKCMEAGCNDYLSKPIKRDQLILMMNKYLS